MTVLEEIDYIGGEEVDYIDLDEHLVYLKGHPHPWKGLPNPEAVEAMNSIKRAITHNRPIPWQEAEPFVLPTRYQQDITRELTRFIRYFTLIEKAQILAHIVEYDSAYRIRLQDLFSETTKEKLATKPIREIWRLLGINKRRDYDEVHRKVRHGALVLTAALLWSPFRARFKRAVLASEWQNFLPDEIDRYWMKRRVDYKMA